MKINIYKIISPVIFVTILFFTSCQSSEITSSTPLPADTTQISQIIFTADLHYGLKRAFRGEVATSSVVNEAMVSQMNALPNTIFPNDGGVNAGKKVDFIDYIAINGDIANREQTDTQSASESWKQFSSDYLKGINLKGKNNQPAKFLLTCGNHDIANAIGYSKPLYPTTDNSVMVNLYNMMMHPAVALTSKTYNFKADQLDFSRNIEGVHLMFVSLWPDSTARVWMEKDLATVNDSTPVLIFTHDPIAGEPTHFTNPFDNHVMTSDHENELEENFKGMLALQNELASFLKEHQNIKAYFHGHTNYNQFYKYVGPDGNLNIKVFRVDSPMKGQISATDETKLSFQVISIDRKTRKLTVRQCLWNKSGNKSTISWGESATISL